jgi:hypothetical protein
VQAIRRLTTTSVKVLSQYIQPGNISAPAIDVFRGLNPPQAIYTGPDTDKIAVSITGRCRLTIDDDLQDLDIARYRLWRR